MAPILQKLLFNREPEQVLEWADKVREVGWSRVVDVVDVYVRGRILLV